DAFYILKDTAMPVITDGQLGETDWRMDDAGAVYNVDFADGVSGLGGIEYSASPVQGTGNAAALAWTPVSTSPVTGLTSYTDNWAVNFAALANNATNFISVRAWDLAGNMVIDSGVDVFKILKYVSGPEVGITAPGTAYQSSVTAISGTASDARSHTLAGTELSFLDVAAGRYWNGADFLATSPVWLAASTSAAWNYTPGIAWAEGVEYQVVARSSDTAGNYSLAYATRAFTFDATAPVITSLVPANGGTVNSMAAISGSVVDVSGAAAMRLMFKRLSDNKWWDFSAGTWTVAGSSATVAAAASWSYSPSELLRASLETMASYYFTLYAADNSYPANAAQFGVYGSTFAFLDDTAPAAIADLTASTGNAPGNISLTWHAPGDDGATGMILYGQYLVQYATMSAAPFSKDDAQAGANFTAGSANAARSKEITALVPGQTYYLRAWTRDDAGNWSAISNEATAQAAPYPDRISG
ncbi:MAG: fibronectin type III domain-containing protein, partial [Dehalococcoidia bacterium]|nr:fibronectin type III domain-containing protein [Dehalococcoidia bacterium]